MKMRRSVNGLLAVLATFFVAPALLAEVSLGPWLQPTQDLATSIGVAWHTATEAAATVEYGLKDTSENKVVSPAASRHFVLLKDLKPGTEYHYRIVAGEAASAVFRFKTSPADGRLRMLVLSDTHFGASGMQQKERFARLLPFFRKFKADLILLSGDLVDDGGQADHFLEMFRQSQDLFSNAILAPALGNHDDYGTGRANWSEFFRLPTGAPESVRNIWYSFDYGGLHIVSGDTILPRSDEILKWLKADLAKAKDSQAAFILYMQHYPVFYNAVKPIKPDEQKRFKEAKVQLIQLLPEHGVDLAYYGHYHIYQRTFPMLPGTPEPLVELKEVKQYGPERKGTIYCQNGSTFYQWTKTLADPGPMFAAQTRPGQDKVSWSEVVVDGETYTQSTFVVPFAHEGEPELIDRFTLVRRQPQIEVASKRDWGGEKQFKLEISVEQKKLRIRIASPGGGGECTLKLVSGKWPAEAEVEFLRPEGKPFDSLEFFNATLANAKGDITEKLEEVRQRKEGETAPQLRFPAGTEHKSLRIEWIDAYRK